MNILKRQKQTSSVMGSTVLLSLVEGVFATAKCKTPSMFRGCALSRWSDIMVSTVDHRQVNGRKVIDL